jgi:hypothetical protein
VRLTKVAAAAVSAAAARLAVPTVRILAHGDAMGPGSRQIEVKWSFLQRKSIFDHYVFIIYSLPGMLVGRVGGWYPPPS